MGTKNNPGQFDCYENALPDEPMFVLLARDPDFQDLVQEWARRRRMKILCGERPSEDTNMVIEAEICAKQGADWRRKNNGIWRK